MKIFLTGASGMVGSAFALAAQARGHQVTGVVGRYAGQVPGLTTQLTLDLRDAHAVSAAMLDAFPDAIVNAAALAEPAQCDADPVLAQALNVALPATLARLAHHLSARLVHLSSEQVFDGLAAPYAPHHPTRPLNLYGRQKVESEGLVLTTAPEFAAVLRLPLLLGDSLGGQRTLHERLLADWAAGRTPRLYTDEIRQPCNTTEVAAVLIELLERPTLRGIFHWAGTTPVSRLALAEHIRDRFKLTPAVAPLLGVPRAADPAVTARRAADLRLDLAPLTRLLKTPALPLADHLANLVLPPPCRAWYFST